MGYQSEAQLEEQLIKKLGTLGYEFVKIKDYDELVANQLFRLESECSVVSDLPHESNPRMDSLSTASKLYPQFKLADMTSSRILWVMSYVCQ